MTDSTAASWISHHKVRVFSVWTLLLLTCVLYWPTTLSLFEMWNAFGSRFYTHGDLVAILSLSLLVHRAEAIAKAPIVPNQFAALLLLPLTLAWLIAFQSNFQLAHQLCLPVVLGAAFCAVFGKEIARICLLPIAYLYFAIPIWEVLLVPLQSLTLTAVRILLEILHVPAHFEGAVIRIPAGAFEIQGGCAGLAYLVVGLAIATYHGDVARMSLRGRISLLALAGSLAILGNWIRVTVVIVSGHLTHMQHYFVRVSHDGLGWFIFAFAMVLFLLLAGRMSGGLRVAICKDTPNGSRAIEPRPRKVALMAGGFLLVGPVWSAVVAQQPVPIASDELLVQSAGGWQGPFRVSGGWRPVYFGADESELGAYRRDGHEVQVYVAAYSSQSQDAKIHRVGNSVLGNDAPLPQGRTRVVVANYTLTELRARDAEGGDWLLWLTYSIGEHTTSYLPYAQLMYALESLYRAPQSKVTALRVRCNSSCDDAHLLLEQFLVENPGLLAPIQGSSVAEPVRLLGDRL